MIGRYTVLAVLVACSPARAADPVLKTGPGPGGTEATAACSNCHSLSYIVMNSVFLSPDDWRAEVRKMRTVFAAPIDEKMTDEISAYLGQYYGLPATR